MNTRKKKLKISRDDSDVAEEINDKELRRSKIRDSNKEFARRMAILNSWSDYWTDFTMRDGEAYPKNEARSIIKRAKKITCPVPNCNKAFTSIGGLKYHYARCNIERSFKCKVCSPPENVKTRGELLRHLILRHLNNLPPLSAEQRQIVDAYLNTDYNIDSTRPRRESKKIGGKSADSESLQSSQKLVHSFNNLHKKVFQAENFEARPYKNWHSSLLDWESINSLDRKRYYPPEFESVNFKSTQIGDKWCRLKVGESVNLTKDQLTGELLSTILFTGGVNTAMGWLPKSHLIQGTDETPELAAIAVNCCPMDKSLKFREAVEGTHSIQFWTVGSSTKASKIDDNNLTCTLSYIAGHNFGMISEMAWCPMGASWEPYVQTTQLQPRVGLLALACGDGLARILSVPHTLSLQAKGEARNSNPIESVPIYRPRPIALLKPPGVGLSTEYKTSSCTSICWNKEDNQRLIVTGYSNGNVAVFDLANESPILYIASDNCHIYQPLKSWTAHGAPVRGVAISSITTDRTLVATGSLDRQVKTWNVKDLSSCLTMERAPITKLLWDYRLRGIITASETAFTSFNNRVRYSIPTIGVPGHNNIIVSAHRSSVWGLDNSLITNTIASADQAGEVIINAQLLFRLTQKKDRTMNCRSLYSMVPRVLSPSAKQALVAQKDNQEAVAISPEGDQPSIEENDGVETDFSTAERDVANKPTKFLLPIDKEAVETYPDFKIDYGLEFVGYTNESCLRANDVSNIYCDRHCDYPISKINSVVWSPNINTYSYLMTATQMGFCRLDRVQIVERIFRGPIETIVNPIMEQ